MSEMPCPTFPLTCLVHLKNGSEISEEISNILQDYMGFEPKAKWNVTCKLYRSDTNDMNVETDDEKEDVQSQEEKILYFLKSSHRPGKAWCSISSKNKTSYVEISRPYDFESIISRCKNLWVFRQMVAVFGKTFVCGDYKIRSGVVNFGSVSRGILMQAESVICTPDKKMNEYLLLKSLLRKLVSKLHNITSSNLTFIPPDPTDSNLNLNFPDTNEPSILFTPYEEERTTVDETTHESSTSNNSYIYNVHPNSHINEAYQLFTLIKSAIS